MKPFPVLLVLAVAGAGALAAPKLTLLKDGAATPAVTVPLAKPERARIVVAPGVVEPISEEHEIASEVRGLLREVLVTEGEGVAVGQIVARLENTDLQARLMAAEASVAARQAELDRLISGARGEEKDEARAALQEADSTLSLARVEMSRRNSLIERGVVSNQQMDQSRAAVTGAEAKRSMMAARLALVTAPPRREDVTLAEANLWLAKAEAEEARARLEKSFIRSPIDGIVLRREKRPGEAVSDFPLTTIVRIGDTRRLRVRAEIDEIDVARVAVGQRIYVKADAYEDVRFEGVVSRVGKRLGQKTIKTDLPTDKVDAKVLEAVIDLDYGVSLPVGLRVDVFFATSG